MKEVVTVEKQCRSYFYVFDLTKKPRRKRILPRVQCILNTVYLDIRQETPESVLGFYPSLHKEEGIWCHSVTEPGSFRDLQSFSRLEFLHPLSTDGSFVVLTLTTQNTIYIQVYGVTSSMVVYQKHHLGQCIKKFHNKKLSMTYCGVVYQSYTLKVDLECRSGCDSQQLEKLKSVTPPIHHNNNVIPNLKVKGLLITLNCGKVYV